MPPRERWGARRHYIRFNRPGLIERLGCIHRLLVVGGIILGIELIFVDLRFLLGACFVVLICIALLAWTTRSSRIYIKRKADMSRVLSDVELYVEPVVAEYLDKGLSKRYIIKTLVKRGWDKQSAKEFVNYVGAKLRRKKAEFRQ